MARTLKELRVALTARLGYGSGGAQAVVQEAIMNSFLYEAASQLYIVGRWKTLTKYWDYLLPAGSANALWSAWGSEMNPLKLERMSVDIGSPGTPYWQPILEGIKDSHYSIQNNTYPQRYEVRADEFEFWPERDTTYTVRVFGMMNLPEFSEDKHVCPIDDNLVFQVALGAAKAHYRHPDAEKYEQKAAAIFAQLRADNWKTKVIRPPGHDDDLLMRPKVI